jgi:predicted deacetylase
MRSPSVLRTRAAQQPSPPAPVVSPAARSALAVAVHDVEPRSFARVKEIREWLLAREIDRVTLLVIPAADLHPIGSRSPTLAAWLRCRVARGDAVAQHGLSHHAHARARWPRRVLAAWQAGDAAEFPGLDREETLSRVRAGRRILNEIELDPVGFVAPGYAYTRALRDELRESFEWFADLRTVHGREPIRSPALCLGASTPLKRVLSPPVVRAAARAPSRLMRIDIHPADFDLPGHVATLDTLLSRAASRDAVTYDELLGHR